jgi:hypothetical protein
MDEQTKQDVELLLSVVRPKLIVADHGGGPKLFNEVCKEFGPIAHRVYLALDRPGRPLEYYHDKETKRVMLDPWTVLNRAKSFQNTNVNIDDVEFWDHCDMIKTLCDYIHLRYAEVFDACA